MHRCAAEGAAAVGHADVGYGVAAAGQLIGLAKASKSPPLAGFLLHRWLGGKPDPSIQRPVWFDASAGNAASQHRESKRINRSAIVAALLPSLAANSVAQ